MTKTPGTPDWAAQSALLAKYISPNIISQWGKQKGTKWLSDLRAEVTAGESVLRKTPEGLVRSVSVTRIYVFYNHPTRGLLELVEDRQEFKDGLPTRQRALNCISEKLLPQEKRNPRRGAIRALKEEIGLEGIEEKRLIEVDILPIKEDSHSYPGLVTEYIIYSFSLTLEEEEFEKMRLEEELENTVTHFLWRKKN